MDLNTVLDLLNNRLGSRKIFLIDAIDEINNPDIKGIIKNVMEKSFT